MSRVRLTAEGRRAQIIEAAWGLAKTHGVYSDSFTLEAIAAACKCSVPTVRHYLDTLEDLRTIVVRRAVAEGSRRIVSQARVMGHPEVPA